MNKVLEALRTAFRNTTTTSSRASNYYPFHQIPLESTAIVRFLPDKNTDNPLQFLIEKITHTLEINGEKRSVPCLSMYKEECPICMLSQRYYKNNDKENGKKYWKNRQRVGQVLVIKDPLPADPETDETHEGKVRVIGLGFQLFGIIKNAFESGELDEVPFAYKGGYNFHIKRTMQGEFSNYTLGSNFARKQSDLDDHVIAMIEDELIDLSTLIPANPGIEKVEALLNASLTGEDYEADEEEESYGLKLKKSSTPRRGEDEEEDVKPSKAKSKARYEEDEDEEEVTPKKSENPVKTKPVYEDDEDDEDEEAEDILAKIRRNRTSKS